MGASKRKTANGLKWRFDFEHGGRRFASESIYTSEAKALKAEREKRAELKREAVPAMIRNGVAMAGAKCITLERACERYWEDVARHHRSASDIKNRLAIVQRLIGPGIDVAQIRYANVNAAVQTRRGELSRFGRPLSPTTVNRDVLDTLRPVRNHAGRVYELALPTIDWGKLRLKERDELHCEFTDEEIERWGDELASDTERLFLGAALTYGPRMGELFFPPDALRRDAPGGPELELGRYTGRAGVQRTSRKDGSLHVVPVAAFDAESLGALCDRATALGKATIWLTEAGAELSYYAMAGRVRRAAKRAGIVQERLVHGMRHHAATAITRANGGALTAAQRLLGHKRITTTQRYANVSKGDLANALARVAPVGIRMKNRAESPAQVPPVAKPMAL